MWKCAWLKRRGKDWEDDMREGYIRVVGTRGASVVALGLALALGVSSHSAAQNKEGTYKGTYTSFGKFKAMPVGKDRLLTILSDEDGQTISDGFLDHAAWQCWGMGDFTKGMGHEHGQCIATDPAGDQVVDDWVTEDHELGAKSVKVIDKFTGGTGKYAGISGGGTAVLDQGFRAPEGSYATHGPTEGNYKLP
jgi:hypothetical protein